MLIKFELILSYYRMFQVQTLVRPVVLLLILTVFLGNLGNSQTTFE